MKKYLVDVTIHAQVYAIGKDEDDAAGKAVDMVFSNPKQDINVDAYAIEEMECDAEDFYDE